jgi:nucleoside-diphosphate-sugar epimerase
MQYSRGERSFTTGGSVYCKLRPQPPRIQMSNVLVLGGTRNLGYITALELIRTGHSVAVLNRGITGDELPADVERIRGTRGDTQALKRELGEREFDMVVDMTTYTANEAREAVEVFSGRTRRHVFISSGQVYLVRENAARPFRESDYQGPLMKQPAPGTSDYESWKYGIDKRDAETIFEAAFRESGFPVTTLRLPMVASERDHYGRIQGYLARIMDGGPILIPDEAGLPLRHVYASDIARLIANLVNSEAGIGLRVNVSLGESMSLDDYLSMLGRICGARAQIARRPREVLEREGVLPDCSPFSGKWMSELDNSLSLRTFGDMVAYTQPEEYLASILEDYKSRWVANGMIPSGYAQRASELRIAGFSP